MTHHDGEFVSYAPTRAFPEPVRTPIDPSELTAAEPGGDATADISLVVVSL